MSDYTVINVCVTCGANAMTKDYNSSNTVWIYSCRNCGKHEFSMVSVLDTTDK